MPIEREDQQGGEGDDHRQLAESPAGVLRERDATARERGRIAEEVGELQKQEGGEESHHRGQHDEPLGVGGEGARRWPGGSLEYGGRLAQREPEASEASHREDDEEHQARDEIDPLEGFEQGVADRRENGIGPRENPTEDHDDAARGDGAPDGCPVSDGGERVEQLPAPPNCLRDAASHRHEGDSDQGGERWGSGEEESRREEEQVGEGHPGMEDGVGGQRGRPARNGRAGERGSHRRRRTGSAQAQEQAEPQGRQE